MKKELTFEEVKNKKQQLGQEITKLVRKFEVETSSHITRLDVYRTDFVTTVDPVAII